MEPESFQTSSLTWLGDPSFFFRDMPGMRTTPPS
jgi:hypothetical protein